MNRSERERIEWTNTWISGANCECDRLLFIGDSVTRDIRKVLDKMIDAKGRMEFDLFATSFSITDELLWRHLRCFMSEEYRYKCMILNLGFHHGFSMQCNCNDADALIYREKFQDIVKLCQNYCDNIVVMTGTSMVLSDRTDMIDENTEVEILARNRIVKDIAAKMKCGIFDTYTLMESNKEEFKYRDHVHFEESTLYFICQALIDWLAL